MLAREAISVPIPPIFTPRSTASQFWVKPDMRIAAGTLLIIWLKSKDEKYVLILLLKKALKCVYMASMLEIFPINMKKI